MATVWIELPFSVEGTSWTEDGVQDWDIYLPNGELANWLKDYLEDYDFECCIRELEEEAEGKSVAPPEYRSGVGDF